ncbi:MAG: type II toxin-antitoxin system VapC family toxin [Proteobacteria bacterium]|nr:type II toxin-antitoxin system VapC family toxin [Pseudomonadota bacterium]
MITHVLDTSALLAHYLREPGAEEVNVILARGPEENGVSLVTLVELRGRLAELLADPLEAERVFKLYTETLTATVPFTGETAEAAMELRAATRPRLPLVDALIAASAKELGATLVHRDPHMDGIPKTLVNQRMLSPKPSTTSQS